jgi:hypothetical protein
LDSVFKKQDDARDLRGAINEKFEDTLSQEGTFGEREKEVSRREEE